MNINGDPARDVESVGDGTAQADDLFLASRDLGDGLRQTDLSVPGIHCAGCIASIEKTLGGLPGVEAARVNLSLKRVTVKWRPAEHPGPKIIPALGAIGFDAHLFSFDDDSDESDAELKRLIRALAVAGFAAMNIMLLSVSVWSGADGALRQAFHWLSAIIAFPAIAYSGRIFFLSAWSALRRWRTNMDVPISLGVLAACALSLYDTLQGAPHAYFDAATSLLFFLLVGRTLDHAMRRKARSAVSGLARLMPRGATLIGSNGERAYVPLDRIETNSVILVAPGQRIPLDGIVTAGSSELDRSLVTGESAAVPAAPGFEVQAGVLNLTGPLEIGTTRDAASSFVAEMIESVRIAENGQAGFRSLAERATACYAPVVHAFAALAFCGWYLASGDLHTAVTIAVAVLIITCPCALGLAVPMVQIAAAQRLFERGILIRHESALERLAAADSVLFDKTGTLTAGTPSLTDVQLVDPSAAAIAAAVSRCSPHPLAKAISSRFASDESATPAFDDITEHAGLGLEARSGTTLYRLGRPGWALAEADEQFGGSGTSSLAALARNGRLIAGFTFADRVRSDAHQTVAWLRNSGFAVEMLSGDRKAVVEDLAEQLAIERYRAELLPAEKVGRIAALRDRGHRVLMVGDGLNDAPALAAANVSMVPASGADVGRNAADLVFLGSGLSAVPEAIATARRAIALIRQNFWLAAVYNALALPAAFAGYVTPLVAAVAMSLSSILVVANSFRLRGRGPAVQTTVQTAALIAPCCSANP